MCSSDLSKKYLKDKRIQFAELDFNHTETLHKQLKKHKEEHGGWDYIVHAAGATKCLRKEDFDRTNFIGTKHFIEALTALDMVPKQFIFISSLSVFGAIRDERINHNEPWNYAPICENDAPVPNTAYGASKLKAEKYINSLTDFPWVTLRPTGVYGPRETDYFLMAKSIKGHIDFAVGYQPQEITFIYVLDLVQAVFKVIESGITKRSYFLSDGEVYHSRAFSDLIQQEMGNPAVLHIKAPVWFLKAVCTVSEQMCKITGKAGTLNGDKYHILKQRNWQCDITPAIEEIGYKPEYPLERGVKEAIAWYKKEGWL